MQVTRGGGVDRIDTKLRGRGDIIEGIYKNEGGYKALEKGGGVNS